MSDKIKHGPVQGVRGAEQGGNVSVMDYDGMGCGFEGEGGVSMAGPKQLFADEGNGKPIQRVVDPHRKVANDDVTQDDVDAAERAAQWVDKLVTEARPVALNWPAYADSKGYLKTWYDAAKAYYDNSGDDIQFVNARFGYAVETLTCQQLGATLEGLEVGMQVGHGDTRPDIILSQPNGHEVAWLDITSTGDKGHIKKKNGAGWSTKPYVAEILYEKLDRQEILSGMKNPIVNNQGQFKQKQQQIRDDVRTRHTQDIKEQVKEFQTRMNYTHPNGKQVEKEKETRNFLMSGLGMDLGGKSKINAKGTLKYLDFKPQHFGYKKGGSSQDQIVSHIYKKSQPDIDQEMSELMDEEMVDKQKNLKYQSFHPEVSAFQEQSQGFDKKSNQEKEEVVKLGIAAQTAVKLEQELRAIYYQLMRYSVRYMDAGQGMQIITELLTHKPNQFDLQQLNAWAQRAQELLEKARTYLNGLPPLPQKNLDEDDWDDDDDNNDDNNFSHSNSNNNNNNNHDTDITMDID